MEKNVNKTKKHVPIYMFFIIIFILLILTILTIYFTSNSNKLSELENIEDQNIEAQNIETQEDIVNLESSDNNTIEETPKENIVSNEYPQGEVLTASNGETYSIIANLKIPSLGIDYPVLSDTSDTLLKISLTKYWGGNPNQVGNLVILGHNYKSTKFFSKLPNIKVGDIIELTDLYEKTLSYSVYSTDIIEPDDNSCTSQKTNGNTEITLITCYYDNPNAHATRRFVAKARAM